MYFQQKISKILIRNFSKYIVIEIKNIFRMPSINGNEFYNLQTFKF